MKCNVFWYFFNFLDFLDFTCAVKECGIPTNYSQVMNYDYIEGTSTTTLGTIIKYVVLYSYVSKCIHVSFY